VTSDFDFLFGHWRVEHRRLKERLVGDTEWENFGGTCSAYPLLGGAGNVDDHVIELPGGSYRAASLRSFHPASGHWTIWWLDGRTPHKLDAPIVGSFRDGVGTFFGDDSWQGKPVKIRFQWTQTPKGPQWEQAFSGDGGVSWEANWVMGFVRAKP
jgi:hypothetical protein